MTKPPLYVTPVVRKLAAQANLDLSAVAGTGVGGRITAGDVRAAAGPRLRPQASTAAASSGPQVAVELRSRWVPRAQFAPGAYSVSAPPTVSVNMYGANPLADEMRAAVPEQFARAQQRSGPPPTLFSNESDLPPITGSGMAPELLRQLPWPARPAAARADGVEAAAIFERFGTANAETYEAAALEFALDPAVLSYDSRMQEWGESGA